jgi:L-amino acid N-acyltransferase YncA
VQINASVNEITANSSTDSRITIRSYQDSDLKPMLTIMNEIIRRGDAFVYDLPFSLERMTEYLGTYTTAIVAVMDERVVGGYVLRANQPGLGSHVANGTYLVAADARGHGIGKILGEHSLAEAKRLGFSAIQFNAVVSTNAKAIALWQRLGFKIIGTVPLAFQHADGQRADLHVMHRLL